MFNCNSNSEGKTLKSEQIANWFKQDWVTRHPDLELMTIWTTRYCADDKVLKKIDPAHTFEGYRFVGYMPIESPVISQIDRIDEQNVLTGRIGAFIFHFVAEADGDAVEVMVGCSHYSDDNWFLTTLACIPVSFTVPWNAFTKECDRLAFDREDSVLVIGGRQDAFVPMVGWDEIILPDMLKNEIMEDVRSFYAKGVGVYRQLNLKPFRKVLLAGVPGTGKTMICNALAKWALAEGYMVVYVSSAQKGQNDEYGSTFTKIQYALEVAADADSPAMIILEELDAYLHDDEKALILNVLDGSESSINPKGTLMLSTTNYPEAIDERVLKRPGRLDRIFIIPEARSEVDAGKVLRHYLGALWLDEHETLVPQLVGYPGAFIREVAVYALTQVAYDDLPALTLELLEQSLERLKDQLAARDDFLKQRTAVAAANGAAQDEHSFSAS